MLPFVKLYLSAANLKERLFRREQPPLIGGGIYRQWDHGWKGRKELRNPKGVRAITVHQTAIIFGLSKSQVRAADGDRKVALRKRFESTPYHCLTLYCGDILENNPPDRYTYHAGVLNRDSAGFAIEAFHPRFASDYNESKHSRWSEREAEDARRGLIHAVLSFRGLGCPISEVWTHSQGSSSRVADPGELIVRDVIAPVARELSLKVVPAFSRGSGHPWPAEWIRHLSRSSA